MLCVLFYTGLSNHVSDAGTLRTLAGRKLACRPKETVEKLEKGADKCVWTCKQSAWRAVVTWLWWRWVTVCYYAWQRTSGVVRRKKMGGARSCKFPTYVLNTRGDRRSDRSWQRSPRPSPRVFTTGKKIVGGAQNYNSAFKLAYPNVCDLQPIFEKNFD